MLLFKEHKNATDTYSGNGLTLKMRLVKLWTVKAWKYITDVVELMPFIPLMENGLDYVRRAEDRIYESAFKRELKADLLTALFFFTGMRDKKLADSLHERRRELMMESAAYDIIKDEWKKKGAEQGAEQEKLQVLSRLLKANYSMDVIVAASALSPQEILEYKASLESDEE